MAFVFYRPVIYCLCTWNESKFKTINHLPDVDTDAGQILEKRVPCWLRRKKGGVA